MCTTWKSNGFDRVAKETPGERTGDAIGGESKPNGESGFRFRKLLPTVILRTNSNDKNTLFPYSHYSGHFVLGVIYSKCDDVADERKQFTLEDLPKIPSVVKDFHFFAQPKFRIATSRPGSGNTKNIGSVIKIEQLVNGSGPFSSLGEEVYDDYWMFYLTRDMAQTLSLERPYTNLKTYLEYKKRGVDTLRAHEKEIVALAEDEAGKAEEESE
ncbi:MAG TPA: type II restriction endonuclease [Methylomirabilota bacterium]|nr:type II restriction endonuclease [Methylomirabilota bacterium]